MRAVSTIASICASSEYLPGRWSCSVLLQYRRAMSIFIARTLFSLMWWSNAFRKIVRYGSAAMHSSRFDLK